MALTERQRRFAEAYSKLANATRAAIEAGYSEKGAHVQGSLLLRNPKVQAALGAKRINRGMHAEKTYENMIALAGIALEEVQKARASGDYKRLFLAIQNADRTLSTLGKCEGLFAAVEAANINVAKVAVNMQQLVQVFEKQYAPQLNGEAESVPTLMIETTSAPKIETTTTVEESGGGDVSAA